MLRLQVFIIDLFYTNGARHLVGVVKDTMPPNWLIRLLAGVSTLTILVLTCSLKSAIACEFYFYHHSQRYLSVSSKPSVLSHRPLSIDYVLARAAVTDESLLVLEKILPYRLLNVFAPKRCYFESLRRFSQ